ncbi:sensor histidine kinase [Streptomyces sp. NPDC088258]|uniref:sensor histidine kinase n=1 Tax=Streptomyces sp. NPDC088258 TaxID=3365849 RepID=UPI00382462A4
METRGARPVAALASGAVRVLLRRVRRTTARGAALRAGAVAAGVVREARAALAAVRGAPRRTRVFEAAVCLLTAAAGLLPLLFVPPGRPVLAVAEACWAALLVPARRRWPAGVVLGAVPLLAGDNVWSLSLLPLTVLFATRRITPVRRAWAVVLAACALAVSLSALVPLLAPRDWFETLAGTALSSVFVLLLPALSGTLLGQRRPLVRLLRERNAYLEQARALTAATARMEERARIAGEMHDMLGHRLSLISVHAGALELAAARQAPPLAGRAELLRTTAGTAMEELREILDVLRREEIAPLSPTPDEADREPEAVRGTRADLTALVAESRQAGVAAELAWSGPDSDALSPRVRQALHRVAREGLTNVHKHAAGAPTRVEVVHSGHRVEVTVTNEAPRAPWRPMAGNRSGLAGLEERITLIGGSFTAGPVGNAGFRIAAGLPCRVGTETTPHPATAEPAPHPTTAAPPEPAPHPATAVSAPAAPSAPPAPYTPSDLSAQTLTWPRLLGGGCAAIMVILPTGVFTAFVLFSQVLR